jgi:hypothetical protein
MSPPLAPPTDAPGEMSQPWRVASGDPPNRQRFGLGPATWDWLPFSPTLWRKGLLPGVMAASLLYEKGQVDQKHQKIEWSPAILNGLISWYALSRPEGGLPLFLAFAGVRSIYDAGRESKKSDAPTRPTTMVLRQASPILAGGLLGILPMLQFQRHDAHADAISLRRLIQPQNHVRQQELQEALSMLEVLHQQKNWMGRVAPVNLLGRYTDMLKLLEAYQPYKLLGLRVEVQKLQKDIAKHSPRVPLRRGVEKIPGLLEAEKVLAAIDEQLHHPASAMKLRNRFKREDTARQLEEMISWTGALGAKGGLPQETQQLARRVIGKLLDPVEGIANINRWYHPFQVGRTLGQLKGAQSRLLTGLQQLAPETYQAAYVELAPSAVKLMEHLKRELYLQDSSWLKINEYNPFFAYILISEFVAPPMIRLIETYGRPLLDWVDKVVPNPPHLIHNPKKDAPKPTPWYEQGFFDMLNTVGPGPYSMK